MSEQKISAASEKIASRNSWLRIFVVVVVTVLFAVKLWQADLDVVLSGFNFSDLLALSLALFSVLLSVLFYLKATETSNVFYDNTYRFTKDVSEILGRVEAGFGERLRHLDEGYSGLKSAVEKIPFDRVTAEKEIEEEEKQVEKVEQERIKIIEDLAQRASLEEAEKKRLFERLRDQDRELLSARREISYLRNRLTEDGEPEWGLGVHIPEPFQTRLVRRIQADLAPYIRRDAPPRLISRKFKEILEDQPSGLRQVLRESGIVDEDDDLTQHGFRALRRMPLASESED